MITTTQLKNGVYVYYCVCVLYYTQENQFCGTRKSQGYSNPFYDVGGIAPATIIADMYVMYIKIM